MNAYTPEDVPARVTAQYLQALQENWLPIEHCNKCDHIQWYPRGFCTVCDSDDVELVAAAGRGTLYSHTSVLKGVPDEAFQPYVPYVFALVDLDEGVRVATWITDCDPSDLEIDMPLTLHFIDAPLGGRLPVFRPATERGDK